MYKTCKSPEAFTSWIKSDGNLSNNRYARMLMSLSLQEINKDKYNSIHNCFVGNRADTIFTLKNKYKTGIFILNK